MITTVACHTEAVHYYYLGLLDAVGGDAPMELTRSSQGSFAYSPLWLADY